MPTAMDLEVGKSALKIKLITEYQLHECIETLKDLEKQGVQKEMLRVLLEKGFITPEQARTIPGVSEGAVARAAAAATSTPPSPTPSAGLAAQLKNTRPLSIFKPPKAGTKMSGCAFINLTGHGQFEICPLPEKPFAIGRDEANDVVVDDEPVSKRHARLTFAGPEITLWDVGSKNGTFVNGERVTSRKLVPGDVVAVGRARLIFAKGVKPDGSLSGAIVPTASQAGAQAVFVARFGGKPPEKVYLGNVPLFIGREKYNNLIIPDPSVSPFHAQIFKSGNEVKIQDLNSSEGIEVNGEPVTIATLEPDDTITIGALTLLCEEILGKRGTGKAKPTKARASRPAGLSADETIVSSDAAASLGAALLKELEDKAVVPGPSKPQTSPPRKPVGLKLTCLAGPVKGKSYPIRNKPLVIGRHPNSDIFLEDLSVSRQHAHILPSAGRVEIVDMGSRNGVEVNGKRVKSQELHPGDKITLGTCVFLVEPIGA